MNPERYQRMKEIFGEACAREGQDRSSFVEGACDGDESLRDAVERLLENDRQVTDAVDLTHFRARVAEVAGIDHKANPPAQIGRYHLLRKVGEGGMGVVYEAQQEAPRRIVALKLIAAGFAGDQVLRRFEHEAYVLGRLQHPGIAQIFEAGTFDGMFGQQPYFAMEFVNGLPLLAYARSRQLTVRERLALFAKVCDAVDHAHLKGVIHRDLKPANILVDEQPMRSASGAETGAAVSIRGTRGSSRAEHSERAAQPKVLDFGVARATGANVNSTMQTRSGQLVGTLSYMSPEQALGDAVAIDTRSDVYSLGVVLHQLLTDDFPYNVNGSVRQVIDSICTAEPARVSSVNFELDDEIDTMVLMCLSKEADRRYQSAGEVARDIRRYLGGEPIQAKRDSRVYVLRKMLQRHWVAAAMTALFAALVTAALVVSLTLWHAESQQRAQAQNQRTRAESVNTVLHNMLASANPEVSQGTELTVADVLGAAARDIDAGSLRDQPDVEASVRLTMGEAYLALGKLDPAEHQLQIALALSERVHGHNHPDVAASLASLAELRRNQGEVQETVDLLRQALAFWSRSTADRIRSCRR